MFKITTSVICLASGLRWLEHLEVAFTTFSPNDYLRLPYNMVVSEFSTSLCESLLPQLTCSEANVEVARPLRNPFWKSHSITSGALY